MRGSGGHPTYTQRVLRPRPAIIVLAVSVAVILVSVAIIVINATQRRQEAEISTVGSRAFVTASSPASSAAAPSAAAPASSTPTAGAVPSSTSATASPSPTVDALPIPVHLRIKSLGVRARIVPVGLDKAGAVKIPKDVEKVGWYELGVPPGATRGSAVLAGHRDGTGQGRGVFYAVGQLTVGDTMTVRTADGVKHRYRVVARELISKGRLPLTELFAVDGPPRLTIISCGGYYDEANGGYQDNVVVTAVPAKAT